MTAKPGACSMVTRDSSVRWRSARRAGWSPRATTAAQFGFGIRPTVTASAPFLRILTRSTPWHSARTVNIWPRVAGTGGSFSPTPLRAGAERWQADETVLALRFSPDGARLYSAQIGGSITAWELPIGRPKVVLPPHGSDSRALAVSPDGRTLATAGDDRVVRLWDVETDQEILHLTDCLTPRELPRLQPRREATRRSRAFGRDHDLGRTPKAMSEHGRIE